VCPPRYDHRQTWRRGNSSQSGFTKGCSPRRTAATCVRRSNFEKEHEDAASQLNRLVFPTWLVRGAASCDAAPGKFYGQAERAISTGKLRASLRFHIQPIKQVVFLCPSLPFWVGRSHLGECFPLICIQRLSQPNFATQPCRWHDSWNTRGSSIPVLSY
jgi:hypothetical protein